MCARNSHSYTHLILALGIVSEPTVWVFITSKYPGTHDIGLPTRIGSHLTREQGDRSSQANGRGGKAVDEDEEEDEGYGDEGIAKDEERKVSTNKRYY